MFASDMDSTLLLPTHLPALGIPPDLVDNAMVHPPLNKMYGSGLEPIPGGPLKATGYGVASPSQLLSSNATNPVIRRCIR